MREVRITSNEIKSLNANEVFVFGSNLSGAHLSGAAKTAMGWGAEWGNPIGLQGKTYAIPTVNAIMVEKTRTLTVEEIKPFVDVFIEFARNNPQLQFLTTEIGCGIAGLTPQDIAPLFLDCKELQNVYLPERFWNVIL